MKNFHSSNSNWTWFLEGDEITPLQKCFAIGLSEEKILPFYHTSVKIILAIWRNLVVSVLLLRKLGDITNFYFYVLKNYEVSYLTLLVTIRWVCNKDDILLASKMKLVLLSMGRDGLKTTSKEGVQFGNKCDYLGIIPL